MTPASPLILPAHLLRYGTFCSGIEAVSVAWAGLDWHPVFFSEIDRFACAVLKARHPHVPNIGDMARVNGEALQGLLDIIVAGTPCQGFSIAGLRMGLEDERGNLTLELVKIYDASKTAYLLWENVPGVLSDRGNAFGCFLGALSGENEALLPPGGKWTDAGYVLGSQRTIAWRVLDAQYFGLAQRRRRVFLVAGPRDGADPRTILFEYDGMRRDSAPRREKAQDIAGTLEASIGRSRGAGTSPAAIVSHWEGGPHPCLSQSHNSGGIGMSDQELFSQRGAGLVECASEIAGTLCSRYGRNGGGANDDVTAGRLVAYALRAQSQCAHDASLETYIPNVVSAPADVAYALRAEGHDASEDGTGRQNLVVMPINTQVGLRHNALGERTGLGIGDDGSPAFTLQGAHSHAVAIMPSVAQNTIEGALDAPVAFAQNQRGEARLQGGDGSIVGCLGANEGMTQRTYVAVPATLQSSVRRLTPLECERLQGFPDGYTALTNYPAWRDLDEHESPDELSEAGYKVRRTKKGTWRVNDPDGPRYKALGNSMAVDVMRWLGIRLRDAIQEES